MAASLRTRTGASNFEHTREVLRVSLLSLSLLLGSSSPSASELADALVGIRVKPARPRPPAPNPPKIEPYPDPVRDVPPGPEEGGPISPEVTPLVEATQTIWAQAGSRSWTGCSAVANEASKQLANVSEDINNFQAQHHWASQAGECPNAPEVLAMAVRSELLRRIDLPDAVDGASDLSLLEEALASSRGAALGWIDDAATELERRGDAARLGLEYWRGRASLSMGDYEAARAQFELALDARTIDSWRIRRLLALTELFRGDLDAALVQAFRAYVDSPSSDRYLAEYVLALVLDRAGDTAGSRRRMKDTLDRDGDQGRMRSLESALPIHERLYLRAFAQTVRAEPSSAMRLWDAYLARPEPEAPERRLAERHRRALEPLPTNLGGMPKPGEAP